MNTKEMLAKVMNERYTIVKRNGEYHPVYKYTSLEKVMEAKEKSDKRGWGWTIKEHTEEDMKKYILINAWYYGF